MSVYNGIKNIAKDLKTWNLKFVSLDCVITSVDVNLAWSHFFKNIFLEFQICDRYHDPADNQKSAWFKQSMHGLMRISSYLYDQEY